MGAARQLELPGAGGRRRQQHVSVAAPHLLLLAAIATWPAIPASSAHAAGLPLTAARGSTAAACCAPAHAALWWRIRRAAELLQSSWSCVQLLCQRHRPPAQPVQLRGRHAAVLRGSKLALVAIMVSRCNRHAGPAICSGLAVQWEHTLHSRRQQPGTPFCCCSPQQASPATFVRTLSSISWVTRPVAA